MPFFRRRRHRHHCPLAARARSANGEEKTCKNGDDGDGGGTTDGHAQHALSLTHEVGVRMGGWVRVSE